MNLRQPAPTRRPLLFAAAALAIVAGSYAWAGVQGVIHPSRSSAPLAAPLAAPGGLDAGTSGVTAASGLNDTAGTTSAVADPAAVPGADGRLSLNDRIAFWTARVQRTPSDFPSLVQLALAEASKARLTADLGLYDQARRQLDSALALDQHHGPTLRAIAQVRFALHDFAGAVSSARAALDRDPTDDGSRAVLGDALLELGNVDEAKATYASISPAAAGPAIDARYAHLDLLTGQIDAAVSVSRRAWDTAGAEHDEDVVFYAYQLGETARQAGDAALARSGFEAALQLRPNDLGSLVGLARLDAHDGKIDSAIAGLRHAAEIAPQPETLALLGDLLSMKGLSAEAAQQYATVRTIRSLSDLAGSVYDRQLLLFELDHGGASADILARAQAALATRHDAFGHDVVAWALYRLGRYDAAKAEIDVALANGSRDARLLEHAGAIAIARGDTSAGRALLQEALGRSTGLDPLQLAEAQRLLAGLP